MPYGTYTKKGTVLKMKKTFSLILALIMSIFAVFSITSCGEKNDKDKDNTLRIGVIQYMSHPSLDNCYNGIEDSILAKYPTAVIDRQIGSSSSADSDCTNFAKNMVASNYDMIIAIATNAAKAAYAATADTDIPVIFCAVSDPVLAGLVESMDKPGELCTGTSDVLDLEAQVNLIKAFQPDVKSIGILYTSSEDNSISNLARFKEICEPIGIEVVAKAVQNASDIPSAANDLASGVDCINNFTDNNVVNNLSAVLSATDIYGIPVYGSEEEQVVNGCLASVSIDYFALGKVTGDMACDVIGGANASEMPVRTILDTTPVINKNVADALEIAIPESFTDVKDVSGK